MRSELLESADAGRILGLTPAAIRRLARVGALPVSIVTSRGTRLFRRGDVERFQRGRSERHKAGVTTPQAEHRRGAAETSA
jgi:DNA-binding transcriptional MerR regulator